MENIYLIKNNTNDFPNIDKEMYFQTLCYYFDNFQSVNITKVGLKEHIYASILDLPIFEIKNISFDKFRQDYTSNFEVVDAIQGSILNCFIVKEFEKYYLCRKTTWTVRRVELENLTKVVRMEKIKRLAD